MVLGSILVGLVEVMDVVGRLVGVVLASEGIMGGVEEICGNRCG